MTVRKYPDLINELAIIQGETYRQLTGGLITVDGDWSAGTPRGQIRNNLLGQNGTLIAAFEFESSVYDANTGKTTIKPFLQDEVTASLAATTWREGRTLNVRNAYVYDIEIELAGNVAKLAYGFVQVIGEVTGGTDAPPILPPSTTFLVSANNLSDVDDPATARLNLGIVAGIKSDWNADSADPAGILNKPTLGTAAAQDVGDFATAAQGTTADTALQPGDIGVTVQGYSANTVIDANYVATENSYTTTEKNKLAGIETGATADQTGAEIKTLYEAEADTNAYTDAEKTKLAGIASGAEVNVQSDWDAVSGDAFILNKPSTFPPSSHTQTASTITDFDTEVSNNTDVAANTSARHVAVTVVDSSEIDLTLTGQQISASLVAGSIDETKLDTSVNASLDLADSALQPGTIGVTVQGYNANTVIDANYVATENSYTTTEKNKLAGIEAGATADQTGAEIKTLYEAEADTNAYTDAEKTKLAGIESGAEVNVNADWNAVSGDSQILNKPTLGTAAATDSTDYATAAQGTLADTALQPSALSNTALTGIPTAPTAAPGTDTTQIATTAFVLANSSNASFNFSVSTVTYNDGGTSTLDHLGGNAVFTLTSNGTSTTIAHSNVPSGVRFAFELHLTWTAGAITFPASWSKGENPPSTTGNYLITGITIDGGTSFTLTVIYQ